MMKIRQILAAATVTFALAVAPSAQGPASPPQAPSFRSAVNLVALNVSVQDAKAHYVTGLHPDDFIVLEDGVRQNVRFFETTTLPIDVIVLLDTSRSMADRLDLAQEAARGFLATLRDGDRGAVIGFSDSVKILAPLTCDHAALDDAIDSTVAAGNTALHTAIYVALRQFGQRVSSSGSTVRRQAIAVLSDGEDTSSLVSFDDVLDLSHQTGVSIYTLRLQSDDFLRDVDPRFHQIGAEADYEMKALARESGALSFFPAGAEQLQGIYNTIAVDLANQYSIGYQPSRAANDGGFRRLQVQIAGRPELRARTRAGYTATATRATTTQ